MDGYAVIRKTTLAWLIERHRQAPEEDLPVEVARDLGVAVVGVDAPHPADDALRTLGPILSTEQHIELLESDPRLRLPKDPSGSQFWNMVVSIVHAVLTNEGQAALRIIGGKDGT